VTVSEEAPAVGAADVRQTPVVEVLLSTHNPDRGFLAGLLESVAAQRHGEIRLTVRDDGSSACTRAWLADDIALRSGTPVEFGDRIGPAESFFELLARVAPTTRYVAFCDQDDVWFDTKLGDAVAMLPDDDVPRMYCSNAVVTDRWLVTKRLLPQVVRPPSFANALVQNVAPGATMVLNRAAIDLLRRRRPRTCMMHDAWAYLVVAGCGQVVHDPRPQLRYRQHDANAIGLYDSPWTELRARARRQIRHGHDRPLSRQAEELRRLYGADLRADARTMLDRFLDSRDSLRGRLAYVVAPDVHRQEPREGLVVRVLYLLNRL
jgi:hypothetical protein